MPPLEINVEPAVQLRYHLISCPFLTYSRAGHTLNPRSNSLGQLTVATLQVACPCFLTHAWRPLTRTISEQTMEHLACGVTVPGVHDTS